MAYCTASEVKTYAGITSSADDTLLGTLITAAQAWIDDHCGRTFEASQDTTRTIALNHRTLHGRRLYLPADLCAITSVVNDADGSDTTITADQYFTEPRAETPYFALTLKGSTSLYWTYSHDAENAVEITGRWAYSTTAPAAIKQACIRLATFLYRQKDASTFDTTAIPDAGVILTPQGMPRDVALMLEPYKRAVLA